MKKKTIPTWLTMFFILSSSVAAQSRLEHGEWSVNIYGDAQAKQAEATVASKDGDELTKTCSTIIDSCVWLLSPFQFQCSEGDQFAFISNSYAGATNIEAICLPSKNTLSEKLLILGDIQAFDRAARAGDLELAFPMKNNNFRIIQFGGNGASVALDELDEFAEKFLRDKN